MGRLVHAGGFDKLHMIDVPAALLERIPQKQAMEAKTSIRILLRDDGSACVTLIVKPKLG
jgi:hypothetical protein